MKFKFKPEELAILKNFATINPSMVIAPHGLYSRTPAGNLVGIHRFSEPYNFERFGIYEIPAFLSIINAFKGEVEIEVKDKFVEIGDEKSKVRFSTTVIELSQYLQMVKGEVIDPYVPELGKYRIENNFEKVECQLEFVLTQEHLTMLMKMSSLINNATYIFFETIGENIKLTVGEKLESSFDTWQLTINEGITTNKLTNPLAIKISSLKVIPTEYKLKISSAGISKWESEFVDYYICTSTVQ